VLVLGVAFVAGLIASLIGGQRVDERVGRRAVIAAEELVAARVAAGEVLVGSQQTGRR
jgi:hypothetical protein